MTTRAHILELARSWLETPYRHQASIKGVGCDCLGLLRGVYRETYGLTEDPEQTPPYSRDWYERKNRDFLIEAAGRHLAHIEVHELLPADVVVFRMKPHFAAKHCAIITGDDTMIHAYDGHRVVEVNIGQWRSKMVAAFRFPELED